MRVCVGVVSQRGQEPLNTEVEESPFLGSVVRQRLVKTGDLVCALLRSQLCRLETAL
jgi:hypothetical protein